MSSSMRPSVRPSATAVTMRPPSAGELAHLLALNNAAVPHVNAHDEASFAALIATAAQVLVADRGGEPSGFVVAFAAQADYDSPNYRWFDTRGDDFCYVDRVVVAPAHRRTGVATSLYRAVARSTDAGRITCEVNVRPPNDTSVAFHEQLGFRPVGTQDTEGGTKTVRLYACDTPLIAGPKGA